MPEKSYVRGGDYRTASVRSVIPYTENAEEIGSSGFNYLRWKDGLYCDPAQNQFRQDLLDYVIQ